MTKGARIEADVEGPVLLWARVSAGISIDDASSKVQVEPRLLALWESGEARPSIAQLRKLAAAYHRPLAVFFLAEPPEEFDALRDFRRFDPETQEPATPELVYEIRHAQARRLNAIGLFEDLDEPAPSPDLTLNRDDPFQTSAAMLRAFLAPSPPTELRIKPGYPALNYWRSLAEAQGVLVFQARGIAPKEARGFSINERPLPCVVLNIKDAPTGRLFTLLHELAHIGLQQGGSATFTIRQLALRPSTSTSRFTATMLRAPRLSQSKTCSLQPTEQQGRPTGRKAKLKPSPKLSP